MKTVEVGRKRKNMLYNVIELGYSNMTECRADDCISSLSIYISETTKIKQRREYWH